ncbi:MAG: hypothetical protein V4490_02560 [Pseudomonadota bacterium]
MRRQGRGDTPPQGKAPVLFVGLKQRTDLFRTAKNATQDYTEEQGLEEGTLLKTAQALKEADSDLYGELNDADDDQAIEDFCQSIKKSDEHFGLDHLVKLLRKYHQVWIKARTAKDKAGPSVLISEDTANQISEFEAFVLVWSKVTESGLDSASDAGSGEEVSEQEQPLGRISLLKEKFKDKFLTLAFETQDELLKTGGRSSGSKKRSPSTSEESPDSGERIFKFKNELLKLAYDYMQAEVGHKPSARIKHR